MSGSALGVKAVAPRQKQEVVVKTPLCRIVLATAIAVALFLPPSSSWAQGITSDFDDGTFQGWTKGPNFNGRLLISDGGNPGFCMLTTDTLAGGGGLLVYAPPSFVGDLSSYTGIGWDEFVPDYGSKTLYGTHVYIEHSNGTTYRTDMSITIRNAWHTKHVPFEAGSWFLVSGSDSFEDVIQNVAALYISMDTSLHNDDREESRVDNITMTATVPTQRCTWGRIKSLF